ncbi:alkaline phosphatase family protein [Polaromonas sp.]|uniref:alkaline phosphatase family protein n=1 Tax=Polaromonas sp. TaxID=1869339 RepID=UPI0025D924CD|nr:alkaline phosphatase family protein [Polaromonas sp.]
MHPAADVRWGENFVADIYNCLRNSQYWDSTLFIVTFDENGGIYDHVLPPSAVPPGDGVYQPNGSGSQVLFDFSLLGPRIPAILISPWIDPGIDSTQYQNTSILRFVQDLVSPTQTISLNQRDLNAPSFASAINRASPRTDCPTWIEGYGSSFDWPLGHVSGATKDSPITITSDSSNIPPSGAQVVISGVQGNTSANGQWIIKVTGLNTFELYDPSDGEPSNGISSGVFTQGQVSNATNTSPIVITTNASSPATGSQVFVSGVKGNTAANGTWTITQTGSDTFSLDGSNGSGSYTSGGTSQGTCQGTWTWPKLSTEDQPPMKFVVDLAKQYAEVLPGHPDSGKPITREFPTKAALAAYTRERYHAALAHYARTKQQQRS